MGASASIVNRTQTRCEVISVLSEDLQRRLVQNDTYQRSTTQYFIEEYCLQIENNSVLHYNVIRFRKLYFCVGDNRTLFNVSCSEESFQYECESNKLALALALDHQYPRSYEYNCRCPSFLLANEQINMCEEDKTILERLFTHVNDTMEATHVFCPSEIEFEQINVNHKKVLLLKNLFSLSM